jgi:hypothetical protein
VTEASPLKRREIIEALRIGSVPRRGLELFAVGLDRFEKAVDEELASVAAGRGRFKAVRGSAASRCEDRHRPSKLRGNTLRRNPGAKCAGTRTNRSLHSGRFILAVAGKLAFAGTL